MTTQVGAVRVGCSGWQYPDWRDTVYRGAPARTWFSQYAEHFDTVELNSTFYRLPSESTVARWRAAAPPGFLYAVKLGSYGTHRKKLRDPQQWWPRHIARFAPLRPVHGPTLVQLPPHWHRDATRLDEFLDLAAPTGRLAIELRDPTWLHDDVFTVLERHGAALCIHDLLADHPWLVTTDWTYVRFHGPHARTHPYAERYTGRRLRPVADRLGSWIRQGIDVYAYFNNDIDAAAVHDARWLRDHLRDERPSRRG